MASGRSDAPPLPQAVPIDAYGNNGFRFGGMSHRGSLLCLPQGMWAWPVTRPEDIDAQSLKGVIEAANSIDTLLIGAGADVWLAPKPLRDMAYNLVAKNRYRIFGKYDACFVPDAEFRDRVME